MSGSKSVESWAVAAERRTARGMVLRSTTRWYLEPGLPRSTGFGPVCSPPFGPDAQAIHAGAGPVDGRLVTEPVEQRLMKPLPDARHLRVSQPSPAGRAAPASERLEYEPPRAPRPQYKDDSAQGGTIRDARTTAFRLGRLLGQQRFDGFPEDVGDKG